MTWCRPMDVDLWFCQKLALVLACTSLAAHYSLKLRW